MAKKTKDTTSKSVARRTLSYFWAELKVQKWFSIGLVIVTPVVIFIRDFLVVFILANLIDQVTSGNIPNDQLWSTLAPQAILLVAASAVSGLVLEKLRLWFCWKMELRGMYNLSAKAFNTLATQSMSFHNDRFGGSLVSQTSRFVGSFDRLIDVFVWDIMPLLFSIIFTVVMLWSDAPQVAIFLLGFCAIYTTISAIAYKSTAKLSADEAAASTKQTGQLADSISNIISVKSYGREAYERKRYSGFQDSTMRSSLKLMRAVISRDVAFSFIGLLVTIAIVTFIIAGPSWFGISIATMILIVTYTQQITGRLWDVNSIFRNFSRIFGDAYEMTQILDTTDTVQDIAGAKPIKIPKGSIRFHDITFQHQDAPTAIFDKFNLDIKPGERVGLVGVSGSGKTTLTKLLLRFADVDQGTITIDGQDIAQTKQVSLRQNIAYVPQETTLFHRSIADNIAYAKPDASREQILRAAKLANADEFIKDLPDKYDTLVGERGVKLSGGQRQRVAIARAILKDAPILVLDEATSALDSESERLIQAALVELMKGRTSIVIAHRLSTVANLDRIIVLKDGKIIEQGTHKQLTARKNGEYAKLWNYQSGHLSES